MKIKTHFSNHIFYDQHWQEPAHTERIANDNVSLFNLSESAALYIGFPWATYIDLIRKNQSTSAKLKDLSSALSEIKSCVDEFAKRGTYRIFTSCQHIHAHEHIKAFKEIRISDLFWSHKPKGVETIEGIRLFPYPLYPVITDCKRAHRPLEAGDNTSLETFLATRTILCSFVGAAYLPGYISDIRERIVDLFSDRDVACIISRDKWHYQGEVYGKQITQQIPESSNARDASHEEEYRKILKKSLFCLCPSGTGPNSIRLWEAISFLSIPVILSNNWTPPGSKKLWERACIFFDEHGNLEELWELLVRTSKDKDLLSDKLSHLQDLGLLYNQDFLSDDLILHLMNPAASLQNTNTALRRHDGRALSYNPEEYTPPASLSQTTTIRSAQVTYNAEKLNRTPFGYSQLAPYLNLYFGSSRPLKIGNQIQSDNPSVHITGMTTIVPAHIWDIDKLKVWHLSEEPLWDILFNSKLSALGPQVDPKDQIAYSGYLSGLYDELIIPYFLLTSTKYMQRYVVRLNDIIDSYSARTLLDHWLCYKYRFMAMCEYRKGARWSPKSEAIRSTNARVLCDYRTRLCEMLNGDNISTLILGKGWHASQPRQSLADWHLNKLTYSKLAMLVSSIENVDHPSYVTEKPFDAFSLGSIPVVHWCDSSLGFRFFSKASVLNIYGLTPDQAVKKITNYTPTLETAESYLTDCEMLKLIFSSISKVSLERRKLARSLWQQFSLHFLH